MELVKLLVGALMNARSIATSAKSIAEATMFLTNILTTMNAFSSVAGNVCSIAFSTIAILMSLHQALSGLNETVKGHSQLADLIDDHADKFCFSLHSMLSVAAEGTPAYHLLVSKLPKIACLSFSSAQLGLPSYRVGDLTKGVAQKLTGSKDECYEAYIELSFPSGRIYKTEAAGMQPGMPFEFDSTHAFALTHGMAKFYWQAKCKSAYVRGMVQSDSCLSEKFEVMWPEHDEDLSQRWTQGGIAKVVSFLGLIPQIDEERFVDQRCKIIELEADGAPAVEKRSGEATFVSTHASTYTRTLEGKGLYVLHVERNYSDHLSFHEHVEGSISVVATGGTEFPFPTISFRSDKGGAMLVFYVDISGKLKLEICAQARNWHSEVVACRPSAIKADILYFAQM